MECFLGSEYSSVYTTARPLVVKDKVIVPATGGAFFVVSIVSGEVLWSENISSNQQLPMIFHSGDIVANPIYYEGKLYIVSQSGFTAAFDLKTAESFGIYRLVGLRHPQFQEKLFL